MATRVLTAITSDLSDKEGASTVPFGLDGTSYEIDLTDDEAVDLRTALAVYVGSARRVGAPKGRSGAASPRPALNGRTGPDPKAVRVWAESNGHTVPARGRIPKAVVEAFTAAGN